MRQIFTLLFLFISLSLKAESISPAFYILDAFKSDYSKLVEEAEALTIAQGMKDTKLQFFSTRNQFKKVEAILEYFDRQFVQWQVNGAPLLKLEPKSTSIEIVEPKGFQIMEEKIGEGDLEAFRILAQRMHHELTIFEPMIATVKISDRMVFEALREELIRITALGITGFDTPLGENTIHEALIAVESIHHNLNFYLEVAEPKWKNIFNQLEKTGHSFFESETFDSFNRFDFIRTYIQPMYAQLYFLQKALFIETRDLVYSNEFSVNYATTSIFDTEFLNDKYYSKYSNSGVYEKRAELGRTLFYDPLLSGNNKRSCVSCHHAEKAFSDGLTTSLAYDGTSYLDRNAPGLMNVVFNTRLFWDARAEAPEDQVEHVLFNPNEFNSSYEEVIKKLNTSQVYQTLFKAAYPKIKTINRYTIVASISAYVQSLKSFNSPFDKYMNSVENVNDEDAQKIKHGFNIFTGKGACATCHFIPTFAGNVPPLYEDTETEVLGIPNTSDQYKAILDEDLGRYANGRPRETADFYKHSFKTPTLRNIALTGPYMHNGVFNTLEEVVEFYNVGGGHGWGIAPENTTLPEDSLFLTDEEQKDLILFMESLTDTVGFTRKPSELPLTGNAEWDKRKVGGEY